MLTVGQKLWLVPSDRRWEKPYEVSVAKVGRKWATLAHNQGRVDMATMLTGGGWGAENRCYLSREAWEAEDHRCLVWAQFQKHILAPWPPKGVTETQIRAAAEALGMPLGHDA